MGAKKQEKTVKRYYWLKLKEEFFTEKEVKKLRKIAGGDTYTIIYLKLMLLSLKSDGRLYFDGIEDTFHEELALEIDEDAENVRVTLMYLEKMELVKVEQEDEIFLTQMDSLIVSESESAQRVREHRARLKNNSDTKKIEAKSNALRQKQFRAKTACAEKQYIPFIEDYQNNKRYGGNYYAVIKRDKFRCAICNSIENLCVHHIDGFDESKPQNNETNKMLTLCRNCHSKVHAGLPINEDILEAIDYFENSNEMLPSNTDVTISNGIETNCNTYTDTYTHSDTHTEINTEKKNKRNTKEKIFLSEYSFSESEVVQSAFDDFLAMRIATKHPMTERAIMQLKKKLETMSSDEYTQADILDYAVFKTWQDIYPLPKDYVSIRERPTTEKKIPDRYADYE